MKIEEILEMNIFKVWSKFVIASIVGVVLNIVYSAVDAIFVGQGVGEAGLASVNIAWPSVTVVIGIGLMIGIGASNKISIYLGQGDTEQAEKYLATSVKFMLALGIPIMIIALVFREKIILWLGATPDTIDYVRDYYTTMYIIIVPYIFSTALNPIVRADGSPNLSMMMIGIGAVANIILDWIFVIEMGLEVKGAAMATSASIFISMIVSLHYFIKGKSRIKLRKKYFKLDLDIIKNICKIGFVSFAIQLSYGIILFVQNNVIYMYGDTVDVAIYTVAAYILSFIVNTFMGMSQGLQPIIGYHIGANKKERISQLMKITFAVCTITGIIFYILLFMFGREIVSVFGVEAENIQYGYEMILLYCIAIPIIGIIFTMSGYYQVSGKNIYANTISISRGFIFQFIFTIILPQYIGIAGVFLSLPIAEFITLVIVGLIALREHKVQKNKIKNQENKLQEVI